MSHATTTRSVQFARRQTPELPETRNGHLVELFRCPNSVTTSSDNRESRDQVGLAAAAHGIGDDPLAPAKGIMAGALMAAVSWAIIGFCMWYLL